MRRTPQTKHPCSGCYTFSVVGYEKLGRKLGIGTRVAAKILRERTRKAASPAQAKARVVTPSAATAAQSEPRVEQRQQVKRVDPRVVTRKVSRGVVQGGRGFGRGFWKPFAHAVRALWHEITGVFFALFAVFFGQGVWRHRDAWRSGPDHAHFVIYFIITLLFIYFSVSAFVSSRHSSQR